MYCRQCGTRVDDAAFCPKCGAACGPQPPTGSQPPEGRGRFVLSRRGTVALIAGALVAAGAAVALMLIYHPAPAPPPAAAQPVAPPATPAASIEASGPVNGFKWSGLSPDQIRDARSALDAAIASEEQTAAHARAGSAATKDQISPGSAPSGTKDGLRL